jgi:hypothetical protein
MEFLDTAAELLATNFAAANGDLEIDVNGWICRVLAQRGGPRYAELLKRVAAETRDRKIRRLASLDIVNNEGMTAEPYRVGTISLATQRAKYTSPYPESTFQNSRAD